MPANLITMVSLYILHNFLLIVNAFDNQNGMEFKCRAQNAFILPCITNKAQQTVLIIIAWTAFIRNLIT